MCAPPLHRLSMTLGLLLFYGKWALRERHPGAWFQAIGQAVGQRRERRARRVRIRPEVWMHFRDYTEKFALGPMLRRHLWRP